MIKENNNGVVEITQLGSKYISTICTERRTWTGTAGELVDNSIDADASIVEVTLIEGKDTSKSKKPFVSSVVVADNGHGMSGKILENSYTFGSDRTYSQGSLGKFGVGGLKSCLPKARRKITLTKASSASRLVALSYDLDKVDESGRWHALSGQAIPNRAELWEKYAIDSSGSGTVIILDELPRIEDYNTCLNKLRLGLSGMFHYHVDKGDVEVILNGAPLVPTCPLGTSYSQADIRLREDIIVDGKKVGTLQCVGLQDVPSTLRKEAEGGGYSNNYGITFSRLGRTIAENQWGNFCPSFPYRHHSTFRYARIGIDFTEEYDEEFGLSHDKASVSPSQSVIDKVVSMADAFIAEMRRCGAKNSPAGKKTDEKIAEELRSKVNTSKQVRRSFTVEPSSTSHKAVKEQSTDPVVVSEHTRNLGKVNTAVEEVVSDIAFEDLGKTSNHFSYNSVTKVLTFNKESRIARDYLSLSSEEAKRAMLLPLVAHELTFYALDARDDVETETVDMFHEVFCKNLRSISGD